jgi:hypothetical protein
MAKKDAIDPINQWLIHLEPGVLRFIFSAFCGYDPEKLRQANQTSVHRGV